MQNFPCIIVNIKPMTIRLRIVKGLRYDNKYAAFGIPCVLSRVRIYSLIALNYRLTYKD